MVSERKSGRVISEVTIVELADPSERHPREGRPPADNFYYRVTTGNGGSVVVAESQLRPGTALDRLLLETE